MDDINKKILEMLLLEARTPLTQIAKKCKIATPSIHSRIKEMKKKGIINGAIMQLNPQKLGFTCCGVLQIITIPGKEEKVRNYLRGRQYSFYDYKYFGKLHIGTTFALPTIKGLANLINQIKTNPEVKEVNTLIWHDLIDMDHPENLVLSKKINTQKSRTEHKSINKEPTETRANTDFMVQKDDNNPIVLSRKDVKIAKILVENAQTPFSRIAKQVGIAPNSVITRYKRLKKEKVISYSSITINLEKLDYQAMVVIFFKASQASNSLMLYNQVIQEPNVIVAIRSVGFYDLMIILPAKNISEIFELKEKFYKIRGIEKIEVEIHAPYTRWPLNMFPALLNKKQAV